MTTGYFYDADTHAIIDIVKGSYDDIVRQLHNYDEDTTGLAFSKYEGSSDALFETSKTRTINI